MSEKMKNFTILMLVVLVLFLALIQKEQEAKAVSKSRETQLVVLPHPNKKGEMSLEETIYRRRSKREFTARTLSKEQISQLLWAAQGITDPEKSLRAVPSAMALYPLELYAVCPDGAYHYLPKEHALERVSSEDLRQKLSETPMKQVSVSGAAMDIVITGVFERLTAKLGEKSAKFVYVEAGHCAQNIHLQAVALGLGSVPVGGISEEQISKALSLPADHKPIYVIPVGYTR